MRLNAIVILLLIPVLLFAQQPTKEDLEKRRQSIMEAIRQTEQQLEATKKDKNATISQLRALQAKLSERQKLINNINDEIGQINQNINTSSQEVVILRSNLEILKIRYAQSVRYAYRSRSSYDMLAFIFSSKDFNEALRRLRYLKKYRDYRKEQADKIRVTQGVIIKKINVLNTEKAQKDQLLATQQEQKQVLQNETNETNKVVKDLKGREKELMADIEKNKRAAKQLDRTISDLIRREIELARKKAEEEAKRKAEAERKAALAANLSTTGPGVISKPANTGGSTSTTTKPSSGGVSSSPSNANNNVPTKPAHETPSYALSLTPEVAALSSSFESNKGRLPWPVEKGNIAEPFGRHQHAVAEKVTMDNKGIEILTSANATARAIFDGEVTAIVYVPGMGQSVLVSHGQYFTVYTRLGNVTVKKGDKVRTKQTLGTVILNDDGVPMMHFELWRVASNSNFYAVDPALWIAR